MLNADKPAREKEMKKHITVQHSTNKYKNARNKFQIIYECQNKTKIIHIQLATHTQNERHLDAERECERETVNR